MGSQAFETAPRHTPANELAGVEREVRARRAEAVHQTQEDRARARAASEAESGMSDDPDRILQAMSSTLAKREPATKKLRETFEGFEVRTKNDVTRQWKVSARGVELVVREQPQGGYIWTLDGGLKEESGGFTEPMDAFKQAVRQAHQADQRRGPVGRFLNRWLS